MYAFSGFVFVVALFGSATAGYYPNHHHEATSYSVVTKHEEPHHYHHHHHHDEHHYSPKQHSDYDHEYAGHDYGHHYVKHEPHHHPKYQFDYGVKDAHTGDHKNQWEHRDGDHVKGGYTLKEADGTTRVVEYTADDHNGFNAIVKTIGHAAHPHVYHKYAAAYEANGYDHGYKPHHEHASSYVHVDQHH